MQNISDLQMYKNQLPVDSQDAALRKMLTLLWSSNNFLRGAVAFS